MCNQVLHSLNTTSFMLIIVLLSLLHDISASSPIFVGYQGWFESGEVNQSWSHWSSTNEAPQAAYSADPTQSGLSFDLWPELSEYQNTYTTGLVFKDGTNASLFSAQDQSTTELHTTWAHDYGLSGFALQRFVSELSNPKKLALRNNVLKNLVTSSEKLHQQLYLMYDNSGANVDTWVDVIVNDVAWMSSNSIFESSAYATMGNKPVIAIWGLGFSDRNMTQNDTLSLINTLQEKGFYVFGGVPFYWRTGTDDALNWPDVYSSLNALSPWSVGRFDSQDAYTKLWSTITGDMDWTMDKEIDYVPVVWPGFSWSNLQSNTKLYNAIPRNCGEFFKMQLSTLLSDTRWSFIYIAMFDEVNEGTAIFKAAINQTQVPINAHFTSLDIDDCGDVPSDLYLQIASMFTKQ